VKNTLILRHRKWYIFGNFCGEKALVVEQDNEHVCLVDHVALPPVETGRGFSKHATHHDDSPVRCDCCGKQNADTKKRVTRQSRVTRFRALPNR
jgi:hypothetical protein